MPQQQMTITSSFRELPTFLIPHSSLSISMVQEMNSGLCFLTFLERNTVSFLKGVKRQFQSLWMEIESTSMCWTCYFFTVTRKPVLPQNEFQIRLTSYENIFMDYILILDNLCLFFLDSKDEWLQVDVVSEFLTV